MLQALRHQDGQRAVNDDPILQRYVPVNAHTFNYQLRDNITPDALEATREALEVIIGEKGVHHGNVVRLLDEVKDTLDLASMRYLRKTALPRRPRELAKMLQSILQRYVPVNARSFNYQLRDNITPDALEATREALEVIIGEEGVHHGNVVRLLDEVKDTLDLASMRYLRKTALPRRPRELAKMLQSILQRYVPVNARSFNYQLRDNITPDALEATREALEVIIGEEGVHHGNVVRLLDEVKDTLDLASMRYLRKTALPRRPRELAKMLQSILQRYVPVNARSFNYQLRDNITPDALEATREALEVIIGEEGVHHGNVVRLLDEVKDTLDLASMRYLRKTALPGRPRELAKMLQSILQRYVPVNARTFNYQLRDNITPGPLEATREALEVIIGEEGVHHGNVVRLLDEVKDTLDLASMRYLRKTALPRRPRELAKMLQSILQRYVPVNARTFNYQLRDNITPGALEATREALEVIIGEEGVHHGNVVRLLDEVKDTLDLASMRYLRKTALPRRPRELAKMLQSILRIGRNVQADAQIYDYKIRHDVAPDALDRKQLSLRAIIGEAGVHQGNVAQLVQEVKRLLDTGSNKNLQKAPRNRKPLELTKMLLKAFGIRTYYY
ncbi:hypothetical protein QAD02_010208 [Eretmocerus hayati]|uniref:Uncharacterized protein n=1 Tax=Eretmocerus hayati TaxID=131215 RepID=A0ACC2NBK5_9HYME|nr:hypothetical protein QAD02_010208 [Eretmocerus hayati]